MTAKLPAGTWCKATEALKEGMTYTTPTGIERRLTHGYLDGLHGLKRSDVKFTAHIGKSEFGNNSFKTKTPKVAGR